MNVMYVIPGTPLGSACGFGGSIGGGAGILSMGSAGILVIGSEGVSHGAPVK